MLRPRGRGWNVLAHETENTPIPRAQSRGAGFTPLEVCNHLACNYFLTNFGFSYTPLF